MSARWEGAAPSGPTPWTTITVPIDRTAWAVADPADWDALLADVTGMHIAMELFNNSAINDERTGLDDVILMQGRTPNCEVGAVEVPVDIKPTSCRNPLSTRKRGRLPVAILGTGDLDVADIDVSTVRLVGVAPERSDIDDVAAPFLPYTGKSDAFDCTTDGPDGFDDLTLKFDQRDVVDALGGVSDGDVLVLPLTATLTDGTEIRGEDVVVILD